MITTTPPISHPPHAVWVEQQSDDRWLAQVLSWADCQVVADSREEALTSLQALIDERLSKGEVVYLPTTLGQRSSEHPMMQFFGVFKDDPDFAAVVAQMRSERELEDDNLAYTMEW